VVTFTTRDRGQAVYETTIAMPLFLLGLWGVIWAMKEASLSARVQLAVRHGGMVSSLSQPYESFSLYSMYATIDNAAPSAVATCYAGDASQLTSGYAPFYQPAASPAPAPLVSPCASSVSLITGPETYSAPIILRNDYASITAAAPVNGYLSDTALSGLSATTVRAAENFFRAPDVGTVLSCSELGPAIKASLEGATDTTTSGTAVASPLPTTVTTSAVIPATTTAACASTTYTAPTAPY
jgi:hypothetical protein